jgi:hypothetical protein
VVQRSLDVTAAARSVIAHPSLDVRTTTRVSSYRRQLCVGTRANCPLKLVEELALSHLTRSQLGCVVFDNPANVKYMAFPNVARCLAIRMRALNAYFRVEFRIRSQSRRACS